MCKREGELVRESECLRDKKWKRDIKIYMLPYVDLMIFLLSSLLEAGLQAEIVGNVNLRLVRNK